MTVFPLVVALLGAQPGPGGVVVLHRSGLSDLEATGLAMQVHQAISAAGASLALDPSAAGQRLQELGAADPCAGAQDCARVVGRLLGVEVLVGLDLAASRKSCALHLEAVSVADGARLARADIVSARDRLSPEARANLGRFGAELAKAMAAASAASVAPPPPPPPPLRTDVPRREELKAPVPPEPANPALQVEQRPASGSRRAAVWACGGGAIAAAAAAVGLGIAGMLEAGRVSPSQGVVDMTYPQAQAAVDRANTLYGAAGGAAGAAIALGAVALVLELTGRSPETP